MDGLLSDPEKEDANGMSNEMRLARQAVINVKQQMGCNFDNAAEKIISNPDFWLRGTKVDKHKVKKLQVSSPTGRDELASDLFRQVVNRSPRQMEIMDILKIYHGNEKWKREKTIKNFTSFAWPGTLLYLYIWRISVFERNRIKAKTGTDKGAQEAQLLKYLLNFVDVFLPRIYWDNLFLAKGKDQRFHVINSLHSFLDRERNVDNKSYEAVYNEERDSILSAHGSVAKNYLVNYSNSNAATGVGGKTLVRIPKKNIKGTGGKQVCSFFNSVQGCSYGRTCNNIHACYKCKDTRHNYLSCYQLLDAMAKNDTLDKWLKYHKLQIVRAQASGGGGSVKRSHDEAHEDDSGSAQEYVPSNKRRTKKKYFVLGGKKHYF